MRVKKDSVTNKDGNRPLNLNIASATQQPQAGDELDTPLLFDQNDFFSNNELDDVMPYSTMPFYPTSMYPYADYNHGQYLDQGSYEAIMNSFFSPTDSNDAADDDTEIKKISVNKNPLYPTDLLDSSNANIGNQIITPNLKNYSLKVKVRHPEKTQKDSVQLPAENIQDRENSVDHPKEILNANNYSAGNLVASKNNAPVDEITLPVEQKNEINLNEQKSKHVQQVSVTPVPAGTIVLDDGTMLVPANAGNIVSNTSPSSTSNVTCSAANKIVTKLLPTLSDISSTTIDSSEIVEQPAISSNNIFEPASPTPTPNSSSFDRASKKGAHMPKPGKDSEAIGYKNQNSNHLHIPINKRITNHHNEHYDAGLFDVASAAENIKYEPKLTPVSTITNIVSATKKNEIEENVILKEAVSKPIKHRTNIADVETAKERSVKNAINARVNRQKHKVYVQTLEDENNELKNQVSELTSANDVLIQEKELLNKEVVYLKSVIANQSTLSNVLSGLNNLKNVQLSSNFAKKFLKRSSGTSFQNNEVKRSKTEISDNSQDPLIPQIRGGICIHVKGEQASLEFCPKCAEMASEEN